MRFTLDSNILLYVHDERFPAKRAAAQEILRKATQADCVLTLQSLAEFFRVASVKFQIPVQLVARKLRAWRIVIPVVAAHETTLDAAIDAVERHRLSFWDAMLWATAREAGCGAILSEDFQDGQVLDGVRFLDPFQPANAAQLDWVLS